MNMDKHQQALKVLIRNLLELDPVCSIYAMGSIGRGDYQPDSDMDIFAITWLYCDVPSKLPWIHSQPLGEWDGGRLDEGFVNGIKTHLNCSTPICYQNSIMTGPILWWEVACILHDPSGIAQWGENCRRQFFKDNPAIAEQTRRFNETYQNWKKDRSVVREFRTQWDFVQSVDISTIVINYESFADKVLHPDTVTIRMNRTIRRRTKGTKCQK